MSLESGRIKKVLTFLGREVFTIPNIISFIRIMMIPKIISLYLKADYSSAAVWIVLSFLSDIADGFIARHFDMVSNFGKILDPVADKLTQGTILICLILRYRWMGWMTAFFAFKELTDFYFGFLALLYTGTMHQAKWYGKLCTGFMVAGVLIMVIFPQIPAAAVQWISAVCVCVLMFSLVMYARYYHLDFREKIKKIPGDHTADVPGIVLAWLLTFVLGAAMITQRRFLSSSAVRAFVNTHSVPFAAAALLLFRLKGAGMPVYTGLLYFCCGYLFGMPAAIAACAAGCAVTALVQYLRGRRAYAGYKGELRDRMSTVNAYEHIRNRSNLIFVLLARSLALPSELIGARMGADGIPLIPYVLGSIAGKALDIAAFSLMGASLPDISSPAFYLPAAVKVLVTCAVVPLLYFNGKRLLSLKQ